MGLVGIRRDDAYDRDPVPGVLFNGPEIRIFDKQVHRAISSDRVVHTTRRKWNQFDTGKCPLLFRRSRCEWDVHARVHTRSRGDSTILVGLLLSRQPTLQGLCCPGENLHSVPGVRVRACVRILVVLLSEKGKGGGIGIFDQTSLLFSSRRSSCDLQPLQFSRDRWHRNGWVRFRERIKFEI